MKTRTLEVFVEGYHDTIGEPEWTGYIDVSIGLTRKRYKGYVWYSKQRSGWYSSTNGLRLPEQIQFALYDRMREEKFRESQAAMGNYRAKDCA